jgi:hypothetical protein
MRSIKGVDLFRKVTQDYHQSTTLGGALSIISLLFMIFLVLAEVHFYNTAQPIPHLQVEPHSDDDFFLLSTNISFPNCPCNSLVIFFTDSTKHHYKFYSLQRTVLDQFGTSVGEEPFIEIGEENEGCGSCYGAETEWRKCCNSCGEVMEAYGIKAWKPPSFADIQQCKKLVSTESNKGPGCRLTGDIEVKKIPGSIHFKNSLNLDRRNAQKYRASHRIDKFLFTDPKSTVQGISGPMDGTFVEGGFIVHYYLKLMPAVKNDGKFYESSANNLVFERISNPEVIFTFDIEPITTIYKQETNLMGFLVNICAIIGGWFAITVFLSRLIIK